MQPLPSDFLPPDRPSQVYVSVSALHAGSFYLPDKEVFEDSLDEHSGSQVPSFAFLIEHSLHGKILFDLGLRKHGRGYPPAWKETLEEFIVECPKDVADILKEGDMTPTSVRYVIYSHLHFDHFGDLTPFASAQLVVGSGAAHLMDNPYPTDPESLFPAFPDDQEVRYVQFTDHEQSLENEFATHTPRMSLSRIFSPLASFEHGLDFFDDGSLYLLDAPGHFPGHLAAILRIAPDQFVLLAADCCHNRLCYDPGERIISRENYQDIDVARDTVRRLMLMNEADNVVIILSHERERLQEMPLFPKGLSEWAKDEIANKRANRMKSV